MTVNKLSNILTREELTYWIAFYELKDEYEEKAIQNVKDKSRARKR